MHHYLGCLLTPHFLFTALWYCVASFIGALSLGYWYISFFYGKDISRIGSGNSGATNAYRAAGVVGFLMVFALDLVRAYGLLFAYNHWMKPQETELLLFASILLIANTKIFISWIFPCFYNGKGVSTSVGILLFFHPELLFAAFASWVLFLLLSGRRVGIASVLTVALLPVLGYFSPKSFLGFFPAFLSAKMVFIMTVTILLIVLLSHRKNIQDFISKKMSK